MLLSVHGGLGSGEGTTANVGPDVSGSLDSGVGIFFS